MVHAVKLAFYRPGFYGAGALTHEAMRGRSDWSIGETAKVTATLADLNTAPIEEPLRATLRMLGKVASEEMIGAGDM